MQSTRADKSLSNSSVETVGKSAAKTLPAVPALQKQEIDGIEPLQAETSPVQRIEEEGNPLPVQGKFVIQQQSEKQKPLQLQPFQLKSAVEQEQLQLKAFQLKEDKPKAPNVNNTGLPDSLKTGVENLSGFSLDDVKVHYNSSKPAQLNALAYAQGADIHIGQGQERHLPHEAWHVVQQKQGRVQPTLQMKGSVVVNDDKELEREADAMGQKAIQIPENKIRDKLQINHKIAPANIYQRVIIPALTIGLAADFDSTNLVVAENQLNRLIDENKKAELRHIERELTTNGIKSGRFESKTNDEKLLDITKSLLENGPEFPDKKPMGYFEKRTATAAVADQPAVDPALSQGINIWVIGDKQRGIVWGAIGNHLRGRIDLLGYRDLGLQCSMLLPAGQQAVIDVMVEPDKTLEYVRLARQAFDAAILDLTNSLGQLPDFNGTSYRESGLENNTVYNGRIGVADIIMDEAFWSTSIFRGAGGGAGNWTNMGTIQKPSAFFIIAGTSGKYISKYAATAGEQEVLFTGRTAFQVTRIVNLKNITFFIYVSEVPPPAPGTPIKNYYNGKLMA